MMRGQEHWLGGWLEVGGGGGGSGGGWGQHSNK